MDAFDRRVGFVLIKLRPAIAIQELALAVDIIVRVAILGPAKKENHVNLGKISKRVVGHLPNVWINESTFINFSSKSDVEMWMSFEQTLQRGWVRCRCANISLHNARAVQPPPDSVCPTDWTTFQGNNARISSAFPTRRWRTVDWVAFQTRTESNARDDRPRFKLVYHFYVQKTVLTLLRLISPRLE